jgi:hypothetical protein
MFGIVANIVMGLLRQYGVTGTGSVSNPAGMVTLTFADGSGVEFRESSTNALYWRLGGSAGTPILQGFTAGPTTNLNFQSNLLLMSSGGSLSWDSSVSITGAPDVGLVRVAANHLRVTNGGAGNGWLQNSAGVLRCTAAQTVTDSATLVNATGFTATLAAGRTYSFHGKLYVTTVATSGVKIDFDGGTATATDFVGCAKFFTASAVAVAKSTAIATDLGSTALVVLVEISGTITVNAAGTFILRFAQNAETGAAESVILGRGSYLMLEDML